MDLPDAIEPVTVLKTRSAELIRRARETRQPVVITQNGKATVVPMASARGFQQQGIYRACWRRKRTVQ